MYVNPFVCGIVATILVEVAMAIIYTVYTNWKGKK